MNTYIKMQLNTLLRYLDSFEDACQLAATRDDGLIDRKERKQLGRIKKATEKYKRELQNIE